LVAGFAGAGGPGAFSFFACPGGVLECPGGAIFRPESFFACPGGVFACAGGVSAAGGWRFAAAGACVTGGAGFSGTVTAGGCFEEPDACLVPPAFAAWAGCTTTGVTGTAGAATAPDGRELVFPGVLCFAFGMVGA
jgi:hypothetical protein